MFGFQAKNDQGSITISDQFPNLIYSERGQIVVQNTSVVDRPAVGSVTFTNPVTQAAPPIIFIRFNSGRHGSCTIYLQMNGTPGNWTGMTIRAAAIGGGTLPRHVLDYVVCRTANTSPASGYGMAVYDSNGNPTYKSQDVHVKYSKFTKSWTRSGTEFFVILTANSISIEDDDYIEVSSMNRGNANMSLFPNYMYSSLDLLTGGTRVCRLIIQNSVTQGSGGPMEANSTFFCMPICKFPQSVYP
jgi:hypothetical protein